jgi:hypothetical protein
LTHFLSLSYDAHVELNGYPYLQRVHRSFSAKARNVMSKEALFVIEAGGNTFGDLCMCVCVCVVCVCEWICGLFLCLCVFVCVCACALCVVCLAVHLALCFVLWCAFVFVVVCVRGTFFRPTLMCSLFAP